MKLLSKRLASNFELEKSGVIFFAGEDIETQTKSKTEKLEEALDKPVYFTTERLRELQRNPDILKNPKMRKKFNGVIRYYLSLLDPNKPSSPAFYTLFRIAGDSTLSSQLGDLERKKIDVFVNDRMSKTSMGKIIASAQKAKKELDDEDINEGEVVETSTYEYWELFHLYMALKGYENLNDQASKYINCLRKNLGVIHKAFIHKSKQKDSKGNHLGIHAFGSADRLFLLQLNTLFQSESQSPEDYRIDDLPGEEVESIRNLTQQFVIDLKNKLDSKESLIELTHDPEMLAYWEYVLELDESTTQLELTESQRLKIFNLVTRKKATDLIIALDEAPIMLPQHYGSLVSLRDSLVGSQGLNDFDTKDLDDKINFEKKILSDSELEVRRKEMELFLDKVARVDNAYVVHVSTDEEVQKFKDSLASLNQLLTLVDQGTADDILPRYNRSKKSPDAGIPSLLDPRAISGSSLSSEDQERYKIAFQNLSKSVDFAWDALPAGIDKDGHRKDFEDALEDGRGQHDSVLRDQTLKINDLLDKKEMSERLGDIEKPITLHLNKYNNGLIERFEGNCLEYADIEVLLDTEESIPGIETSKIDKLRKTRNKIVDILEAEAEKIFDPRDLDTTIAQINYKVLTQAGARGLVLKKNQELLLDYSKLGSVQNQLIKASFPKVREKVFSLLGTGQQDRWSQVRIHHLPERLSSLGGTLGNDLEGYRSEQSKYDGLYAESVHYLRAYCDSQNIKPFPEGFAQKNVKALHKIYMEGGTFTTGLGVQHTFPGVNRVLTVGVNASAVIDLQKETHGDLIQRLDKIEEDGSTYRDLQNAWKASNYDEYIESLELELASVYGDDNDLFQYIKQGFISQLKGYKSQLDNLFSRPLDLVDVKKHVANIRESLNFFQQHFDVRDGYFKRELELSGKVFSTTNNSSLLEKTLNGVGDGFAMMVSQDLLEKNEEGDLVLDREKNILIDEDKFKNKWDKERVRIGGIYKGYQDRVRTIRERISEDLYKMSDDNFMEKYGFDEAHAHDLIKEYDGSLEKVGEWWNKFEDDKYADNWLDRYNTADDAGRSVLVSELSDWEAVADNTEKIKNSSDEFIKWEQEYQASDFGDSWTKWMIRKRKKFSHKAQSIVGTWEIHTFSLMDVYQIWQKFWEGRETVRKRRSDQEVANLGQFFTFGQSSKEFRRMGEDSEGQRVKEFEDNYEDLENYQIREYLHSTRDNDEARACINMLNKSGWLQWGDPGLWKTLMRLGGGVEFDIPGDKFTDQQKIEDKVRRSCAAIWGDKIFERWQNEKQGNLESAMGLYKDEFDRLEKTEVKTSDVLSKMLERWASGDVSSDEVNPVKYESFLKQAIEKGKLNGNPDSRLYFFVMGVSVRNPNTGQTLLDPDVFNRFQSLMDNYPYIEFFIDSRTTKIDGKIVPKGSHPDAKERAWNQRDFDFWRDSLTTGNGKYKTKDPRVASNVKEFFYQNVIMSNDANTRMGRKVNVGGTFDHDDAFSFSSGFNEESTAAKLTLRSEGTPQLTDDFWMNFLVGQNQNLFGKYKQIQEGDNEYGKDNEAWMAQRESILRDVSRYMRSSLVATQTLWGNGSAAPGSVRTQEFNDKYLTQGGSYGVQAANDLKQTLNVAFKKLFELNRGTVDKNDFELLEYDRKNPSQSKIDSRYSAPGKDGREARGKLLESLVKEEKSKIFDDTENIFQALEHYCNSVDQTDGGYTYKLKPGIGR